MIGTWNVRGLNASVKQRDAVDFVHNNKLGLVGFLETKLRSDKLTSIYNRYFQQWLSLDNCDQHPRGRIWVLWREGEFKCTQLAHDKDFIHLHVQSIALQHQFHLTIVYASNDSLERYTPWEKLINLKSLVSGAWVLTGDLNNVLSSDERVGGIQASALELLPFQDCLTSCGVEDMKSRGACVHVE